MAITLMHVNPQLPGGADLNHFYIWGQQPTRVLVNIQSQHSVRCPTQREMRRRERVRFQATYAGVSLQPTHDDGTHVVRVDLSVQFRFTHKTSNTLGLQARHAV